MFREKVLNGKVIEKARLVPRGSKQCSLDQDVYSAVAWMVTIIVLLSLYIQYDLHMQQIDVNSAFLYDTLDIPVYIYQPDGLEEDPDLMCTLTVFVRTKKAPKRCNAFFV